MWVLASVASFSAAIALHALACRALWAGNRVIRFLIMGGSVGFILIGALYCQYGWSSQLLAGTIAYAFFCELYLFLFASTLTSISANLLLTLSRRGMTQEEIDRLYDSSAMVKLRIERMISTGLIVESESGVLLAPKGRLLLGLLQNLRRFFHHTLPQD